jgi:hypothetical protein
MNKCKLCNGISSLSVDGNLNLVSFANHSTGKWSLLFPQSLSQRTLNISMAFLIQSPFQETLSEKIFLPFSGDNQKSVRRMQAQSISFRIKKHGEVSAFIGMQCFANQYLSSVTLHLI